MSIIDDILKFINCWGLVDVVFFGAIIVLLILIVTLIYFIKINKEVLEDDIMNNDKIKTKKQKKPDIVDEIINKVSKNEEKKEEVTEYNDEDAPLIDLNTLTKKLEENKNAPEVVRSDYEKDQEEKAIISYTELLEKCNNYSINYEKEEVLDDLVVKKVNLNDLENKEIKAEINKSEVRVISYQKEEDFLKALKELNSLLS